MRLTGKLLTKLEESLHITLTPEQRVIMLHWYGHEPRHGWDEEDFVYGIRTVQRYYPDHRPRPIPDFLRESRLEDNPF
jgi:hypothetical protein